MGTWDQGVAHPLGYTDLIPALQNQNLPFAHTFQNSPALPQHKMILFLPQVQTWTSFKENHKREPWRTGNTAHIFEAEQEPSKKKKKRRPEYPNFTRYALEACSDMHKSHTTGSKWCLPKTQPWYGTKDWPGLPYFIQLDE